MFIRVKSISGKKYGYLVENTWTGGKTVQKMRKYLGRILEPEPLERKTFSSWKDILPENYISNTPFRQVIRDLIRYEVEMHRLPAGVEVTKSGSVKRGTKNILLAMNEGYLCRHTARRLLNAKPVDEDRRGEYLAEMITRAGLNVEKQMFILLYRKLYNI